MSDKKATKVDATDRDVRRRQSAVPVCGRSAPEALRLGWQHFLHSLARDRTNMLDIDEYLHLALHASSIGDRHACMTYLKEVLQQQPQNTRAAYLLAAQHAELGLLERAIKEIQAVLAIDPRLEIARFQLGLLLLDRRRMEEAREHFVTLGDCADRSLRTYSQALLALLNDDLAGAREYLASGLSQEPANLALTALMRRLLDELSQKNGNASGEAGASQGGLLMGAYRQRSA